MRRALSQHHDGGDCIHGKELREGCIVKICDISECHYPRCVDDAIEWGDRCNGSAKCGVVGCIGECILRHARTIKPGVVAYDRRHSRTASRELPCDVGTKHTCRTDHDDMSTVQFAWHADYILSRIWRTSSKSAPVAATIGDRRSP